MIYLHVKNAVKGVIVSDINNPTFAKYAGCINLGNNKILSVAHSFENRRPENSLIRTCKVISGQIKAEKEMNHQIKNDPFDFAVYGEKEDTTFTNSIKISETPLNNQEQVYIVSPHPDSDETLIIPAKNQKLEYSQIFRNAPHGFSAHYLQLKPDNDIPPNITLVGFCGSAVVNAKGELVGMIGKGKHLDQEHLFAMDINCIKPFL